MTQGIQTAPHPERPAMTIDAPPPAARAATPRPTKALGAPIVLI